MKKKKKTNSAVLSNLFQIWVQFQDHTIQTKLPPATRDRSARTALTETNFLLIPHYKQSREIWKVVINEGLKEQRSNCICLSFYKTIISLVPIPFTSIYTKTEGSMQEV